MSIERLILGTAGIGGIWGKTDPEASVQTILMALEHGVKAIDTAPAYAHAEMYVGLALQQWKGEKPQVSSKVGRLKGFEVDDGRYDYSRDGILHSLSGSLNRLRLSELDVLFLHEPDQVPIHEFGAAAEVMQELKANGIVKATGLGGNLPDCVWPFLEQGLFDVLMEFNRLNACQTPALTTSLPACILRNILYYAASPLNMGLLGRSFYAFETAPPLWLPAKDLVKARNLRQLADEAGMPLRAIAHRFLLNIPFPFHIVIGPSNPEELTETLGDFAAGPLPATLYGKILELSKDIQYNGDY